MLHTGFLHRKATASSSRKSFGSKRYFWRNLYVYTRSYRFGIHTYSLLTHISYEKVTDKHTTSCNNLCDTHSFSRQLILHFKPNYSHIYLINLFTFKLQITLCLFVLLLLPGTPSGLWQQMT
jgi:hypothetical protein